MLAYRTNYELPKSRPVEAKAPSWTPRAPRRPFTKEESGMVARLWREGVTQAEIGRRVGRTAETVRNHLVVLGLL